MHVFSVSVVILSLVWIERGIEVCLEVCRARYRVATDTEMASQQAVNSSLSSADIQKVHELIQFLSSSGSSAAFVATSNRELSNRARPNLLRISKSLQHIRKAQSKKRDQFTSIAAFYNWSPRQRIFPKL